jgi:hypothetical protein
MPSRQNACRAVDRRTTDGQRETKPFTLIGAIWLPGGRDYHDEKLLDYASYTKHDGGDNRAKCRLVMCTERSDSATGRRQYRMTPSRGILEVEKIDDKHHGMIMKARQMTVRSRCLIPQRLRDFEKDLASRHASIQRQECGTFPSFLIRGCEVEILPPLALLGKLVPVFSIRLSANLVGCPWIQGP